MIGRMHLNYFSFHATPRIEIMTFANEIPLKINSLPFEIENIVSVPMEIMILDVEGEHFISRSGEVQLSGKLTIFLPMRLQR